MTTFIFFLQYNFILTAFFKKKSSQHKQLECAASNGNRYPPVSTSDGNSHLPIMTTALLCPNPNLRKKNEKKKQKKKKNPNGLASMLAEGN